jgi:plastocyanin
VRRSPRRAWRRDNVADLSAQEISSMSSSFPIVVLLSALVTLPSPGAERKPAAPGRFAPSTVSRLSPVTHDVRMIQEGSAFKFVPARVTAKVGDALRFVMETGAPHNVAFDTATVPVEVRSALGARMADQISVLAGPLLTDRGATYTISLEGVKPGTYDFFCMPHFAMGMKGTLVVQ